MPPRPEGVAAGIAWDAEASGRWEEAVAAFAPSADTSQETGDLTASLQAYLGARFPADQAGQVLSATRLPGGRSKDTYIVETEGFAALPDRLVLRADSGRTTVHDSVAREYPLICAVHDAGCPAPEPLWLELESAVIGRPFIAFRHMPGEPAGTVWNVTAGSGEITDALARALARLHAVQLQRVPGGRPYPARDAVVEHFESFEKRWQEARLVASPIIANAFAWLKHQGGCFDGDAVVVHGDAHFSNMLMDRGRLICLLDWEFWHFGHPAEDLAYCRPYVEQVSDWGMFLDQYRAAGGRDVSTGALAAMAVWRPLRNAVLSTNVAHQFVTQEDLDLETAAIALSTLPRMERQVAAELAVVARGDPE